MYLTQRRKTQVTPLQHHTRYNSGTTSALPDEGRSEYRVQYTQAGHNSGWLSFAMGGEPPLLPLMTIIDEGLSAYLPVPLLVGSHCFDEFCLEEGEEDVDDDEEGDDELLSLLQLESRHRLPVCSGLAPSGFTFSRPDVWLRSR